jgi:hypothetical protein
MRLPHACCSHYLSLSLWALNGPQSSLFCTRLFLLLLSCFSFYRATRTLFLSLHILSPMNSLRSSFYVAWGAVCRHASSPLFSCELIDQRHTRTRAWQQRTTTITTPPLTSSTCFTSGRSGAQHHAHQPWPRPQRCWRQRSHCAGLTTAHQVRRSGTLSAAPRCKASSFLPAFLSL